MERILGRVCGLDISRDHVHACVLLDEGGRKPRLERKQFQAHSAGLRELRAWLIELEVTHAAMEGTGVYWMPVFATLEGHLSVIIANARHIKQVPGRKTDVTDAHWIAMLLQHGLLKASFVPPKEIRPIRDLTRYRRSLVHARSQERNRVLKLLEQTGVKLAAVASDAFGKSGMDMLNALVEGTKTAAEMARLARGRMTKKHAELELALDTTFGEHHRFMLKQKLAHLALIDADVVAVESKIRELVGPYRAELDLLKSIPGVHETAAIDILSEIGPDLSSFETEARFASWSGLCPGNNITGGKARWGRRRTGNPYLQSALFECALSATNTKGTYLRAKHRRRVAAGRNKKSSIFAVAHALGRAVHVVLTKRVRYAELGEHYFDKRDAEATARRLLKRLAGLGLTTDAVTALMATRRQQPDTTFS
jgi:transposase